MYVLSDDIKKIFELYEDTWHKVINRENITQQKIILKYTVAHILNILSYINQNKIKTLHIKNKNGDISTHHL